MPALSHEVRKGASYKKMSVCWGGAFKCGVCFNNYYSRLHLLLLLLLILLLLFVFVVVLPTASFGEQSPTFI